jgi:hypothetical protein
MQRVVYAQMPVTNTRRSVYLLLLATWLLLAIWFVIEAAHLSPTWRTLGAVYYVLPIGIGTRMLARLGELEQQARSDVPTPEMRGLFNNAIRVVVAGSILPVLLARFL